MSEGSEKLSKRPAGETGLSSSTDCFCLNGSFGDLILRMAPSIKGRIVEWNSEKAYGFLQAGRQRVFLHSRDFAEKRKAPEIGDKVRFEMDADSHGRPCAIQAVHLGNGGEITFAKIFLLTGLLVLPILAGVRLNERLPGPGWVLPAYAGMISLLTFAAYGWDKRRARNQGWRVPENSLHLLELIGGWPGAFLAQRWFRHKVSKRWFQFLFWLIVAIYQFAALDSLLEWRMTRSALGQMGFRING